MVPRLIRRLVMVLSAAVPITACSGSIADLTCNDLEAEVVQLSKGSIIKVVQSRETNRSASNLTCHGMGIFSDNSDIPIRYRAYIDEDNEIMLSYDTDEAQEAERVAEQKAADVEVQRMSREIDRIVEDAETGIE